MEDGEEEKQIERHGAYEYAYICTDTVRIRRDRVAEGDGDSEKADTTRKRVNCAGVGRNVRTLPGG